MKPLYVERIELIACLLRYHWSCLRKLRGRCLVACYSSRSQAEAQMMKSWNTTRNKARKNHEFSIPATGLPNPSLG